MSGAGTLNPKSKSVTATGTFTRKSPNGNSLETGIWIANEFVSFDSYGIAPGARMQAGSAFAPPHSSAPRGCPCSLARCRQAPWPYSASASCPCGVHREPPRCK
jgi:hypothetical protein